MRDEQIARIRQFFNVVADRGDEFVARFYERLFKRYPGVRAMFPEEMSAQRQHLMDSLVFTVRNLEKPAELEPVLKELGARHVGYGVKREHYPIVRDELISTIREYSGTSFSKQHEGDWREALDMVAQVMLNGAQEP